jgi:uncharacterized protein
VIEVRIPQNWDRPLPAGDGGGAQWWSAAAEGRFMVQRCAACGSRQFYPRALCIECGGEPDWEVMSGWGKVHTFTVIRQNGSAPFRDELPYVVAIVELDEGPRMMGNVTGCPVEDVVIGMSLVAHAVRASDDVGIICWEPVVD